MGARVEVVREKKSSNGMKIRETRFIKGEGTLPSVNSSNKLKANLPSHLKM